MLGIFLSLEDIALFISNKRVSNAVIFSRESAFIYHGSNNLVKYLTIAFGDILFNFVTKGEITC